MVEDAPLKKPMPKGGAKGGTKFPRQTLDEAVGWARKLVSKTHVEAQPQDVVFAGVVGAGSGRGKVRISTLKQYGFLDGDPKGYSATALAKRLVVALDEERPVLLQEAFLRPPVFQAIFVAFQGDEVSRAKLRQRVSELKVHPDELDACVELYIAGLGTAGLGQVEGDRVIHQSTPTSLPNINTGTENEDNIEDENEEDVERGIQNDDAQAVHMSTARAIYNVNITLDAAMDADKLEKHLKLLRKYGVH